MTIRPGAEWGRLVPRPPSLRVAADDAELAALLTAPGGGAVAVGGGDLARTLGNPPLGDRELVNELPIDLVTVTLDDTATHTASAHVTARSPWRRGGWWRGPVLVVMNAEFLGPYDVAPRGHPNDGRVEVCEVAPEMPIRARAAARRRARHAGHVPHPAITTRSVRRHEWAFPRPMTVHVDGRPVGTARRLTVAVVADAALVYA